jgi:hypothetical protein
MSEYDGTEDDDLLQGSESITEPLAPSGMLGRVSGGADRADSILNALLAQSLRTGSQAEARPSNAADIANAQTRVSRILSKSLEGMDGTSGLERVGSAALQTLAGQGRVSFPQAVAAIESQDVGRAYNIANALSGLAKSGNVGALTPVQIMNLIARNQESARREKSSFQNAIDAQIRDLSRRYEDPAAVTSFLRGALAERDKDVTDYASANKVFSEVASSLSAQGFKLAKPAKSAAGGAGAAAPDTQGGGLYYENDEPKWRPFTYSGKGQQPEWEKQANYIARTDGPEAAHNFVMQRSGRTSGVQADERQRRTFEFRAGQQANTRTDQFDRDESRAISTLAGRYGTNASVVEQHLRDFIQNAIVEQNIGRDAFDERRRLFADAVADLNKSGIRMEARPQARQAATDANIPMLQDGTPNYAASIPNPKDAFGRLWNAATPERRVAMLQRKIDEQINGKDPKEISITTSPDGGTSVVLGAKAGTAAATKSAQEYEAARTGYESVKPILARMNELIDRGGQSIIGPLGSLANTVGFFRGAANELFGNALPADLRGSDEDIANRFDSVLGKAGLSNSGLSKFLSTRTDEDAQALKTNIVFAMYYIAKTLDGTGNLSNKDTQNVLQALGLGWNSAAAAKAALREVDNALSARVQARFASVQRTSPQGATAPQRQPGTQPPGTQGAPSAAAPEQKVYPTPSRAAIDALRKGQRPDGTPVTREDFDGYFGPGSAERALRGGG